MSGVLKLSWAEYLDLCDKLCSIIDERFDNILIIGTGGWIVGKIINKKLKLPIFTLICKSYKERTQCELRLSRIIPEKELTGDILIVDDLIDTGNTILAVIKYLESKFKKIRKIKVAVLLKKIYSNYKPDYYILETDKWVVFPYEN